MDDAVIQAQALSDANWTKKSCASDARAIAQAMRVGRFTAVHVKAAASQELRMLLTNRKNDLPGMTIRWADSRFPFWNVVLN